jgi:hypothetical protein
MIVFRLPHRRPDHPVHRAAREHKEMIRSYLRGLAAEVEGADPVPLSEQLYLLVEGAITASQLHGEPRPAEYAGKRPRNCSLLPVSGHVVPRRNSKRDRESWLRTASCPDSQQLETYATPLVTPPPQMTSRS